MIQIGFTPEGNLLAAIKDNGAQAGNMFLVENFGAAGVPNAKVGGSISLYSGIDSSPHTVESSVDATQITTCWI
eukprot:4284175-Ditylum_brightwellii.AAC.2